MTTADEVLNVKFRSTKFRPGYDQDDVDDFLDRVVATLRGRESGLGAPSPVTPAEIDAHPFATTKFREGYEPQDVDAFLARVRAELGAPPRVAPAAVPRPAAAGAPPPGMVEAKGWRRLFGG